MPHPIGERPLNRTLRSAIRHPVSFAAGSIGLVLALYYPAFGFPVFHDDAIVMRAVSGASLGEILSSGVGLAYYRPASLGIWKIYELAAGRSWPAVLHWHNIVLFMLSGWLVVLLARRLYPERVALPWLSMSLFLTFPFSYQAVTWTSAGVHLQVVSGTLAALLLIDIWWETRRVAVLALAWILLALATYSHESGVMAAILMAGWLLNRAYKSRLYSIVERWRPLATALVPAFLIMLSYVVVWVLAPKVRGHFRLNIQDIGWNMTYFSQGLVYPVAQLGGVLANKGLDPVIATWLLAAIGLVLLGILAWTRKVSGIVLGSLWYVIGIILPAAALSDSYVVDGARLMLLASVGAAIVWAAAITELWNSLRGWRRIGSGLLALVCLVTGIVFVQQRMMLHERMAGVYNELFRAIRPEEQSVVVNLPTWLAPDMRVYALGNEGVSYFADYYPLTDLFWANTGATPALRRFVYQDISPALAGHTFGMAGERRPPDADTRTRVIRGASAVYIVAALNDRWALLAANKVAAMPSGVNEPFANGIRVNAAAHTLPDQSAVLLSLTWQISQPVAAVPYIHLMCEGSVAAQADGSPLHGLYPFDQWQTGETWREDRLIALPDSGPETCQSIYIGLTDLNSGARVALVDGGEFISVALVPTPGN